MMDTGRHWRHVSSYSYSYLELDKTGLKGSKLKKGISNMPKTIIDILFKYNMQLQTNEEGESCKIILANILKIL